MSNQLKTKPSKSGQEDWSIVRDAITERWPQINRDELAECKDDACELVSFVKDRVGAKAADIESIVKEFAPQSSVANRVAHAASEHLHQASESAQFAYMRADERISERPTESVLAGFLTGIVVGVTVTALLMRGRHEPSTWDRVKNRTYF